MHHAQIAQRAFNTPLTVDPAKAIAFLSGLWPRIIGKGVTFPGLEVETAKQTAATLPARASVFGNDRAQRQARSGGQPFAVVDGIAVIKIRGTLAHRGAWDRAVLRPDLRSPESVFWSATVVIAGRRRYTAREDIGAPRRV